MQQKDEERYLKKEFLRGPQRIKQQAKGSERDH